MSLRKPSAVGTLRVNLRNIAIAQVIGDRRFGFGIVSVMASLEKSRNLLGKSLGSGTPFHAWL